MTQIPQLYYPSLSIDSYANNSNDRADTEVGEPGPEHQKARLVQKIRLTKVDSEDAFVSEELESIERHSQVDLDDPESGAVAGRWGKARLGNGRLLRSRISDRGSSVARFYRWFEVRGVFKSFESSLF